MKNQISYVLAENTPYFLYIIYNIIYIYSNKEVTGVKNL